METRANYVLIGAFTIAGLVGMLAFFLWFARVELDRQFDYYDIRFSSVSGLANASEVRFSGLPVGQVVDVRLAPDRDGTILVRIEVDAETPVRTDSVATIEAQGVTGVSFVGIGPGTPSAPLLKVASNELIPEIEAGRSVLQTLSEDAPRLLEESLQVIENVGALIGAENQARVEAILANVESASEQFAATLEDFSSVTSNVSDFAEQIAAFNATLDSLTGDLSGVLSSADATLVSIGAFTDQGREVLSDGAETLDAARSAIARAEQYVDEDLAAATAELGRTGADLRRQAADLGAEASTLMTALGRTGDTATERLVQAEATLEAANALIARLDEAVRVVGTTAEGVDALVRDEATPLVAETRALVATADRAVASVAAIAVDDLPGVVADIKAATAEARATIDRLGTDLSGAGQAATEALASTRTAMADASATFANANETLSAINAALETGDRAFAAAERAFSGADRVINEEVAGLVDSFGTTLGALDAAIAQVAADLPELSADLRAASGAAAETFAELRRVTGASAPAVEEFTAAALPQFSRLAREARELIGNLDQLTNQIQRDPSRFFLNGGTPEFRR